MGCGSCAEIWRPCGALRMFVLVVYMGLPLSIWDYLAGCRLFHRNPQAVCKELWAVVSGGGEEKPGADFRAFGQPIASSLIQNAYPVISLV